MNSSKEHFAAVARKKCFNGNRYRWYTYCKLSQSSKYHQ